MIDGSACDGEHQVYAAVEGWCDVAVVNSVHAMSRKQVAERGRHMHHLSRPPFSQLVYSVALSHPVPSCLLYCTR